MKISKKRVLLIGISIILVVGFIIPQKFKNPVVGASSKDFNAKSFWYYPWGKSGTHKGVDIFAKEGTDVVSSTGGLVVFTGQIKLGGKVVIILGPKWRLHYYAHLQRIDTHTFSWMSQNENIGTVGTTGNAKGKQPHLHYSIITPIPYIWRADREIQGWKKMFYLNPLEYLDK